MLSASHPFRWVSGVMSIVALGVTALPMSVLARDATPSENDLVVSSHPAVSGAMAATTLSSLSFSDLPFSTGVGTNAIADLNGDGHLDVVNGLGLQVWLGNGDGTLTSVASPLINGFDIAIADLDGDGQLDAVTTGSNGFVQVFAGNGDGTFQDLKKYKGGKTVIDIGAGDLNGDGIPEIVGTDPEDNKAFVLVRNSGGGYKDRVRYDVGSVPRAIRIADMNGDGRPDLVVANSAGHTISILLGNGDTTFQPQIVTPSLAPVGTAPRILRVGDFNGDGKLDVAASMTAGSNVFGTTGAVVLLGNGDGTLGAKTSYALGNPLDTDRSLDMGDLNQDGVLDLAVTFTPVNPSNSAGVHILLGNGDGTFTFDGSQTVTQSSNTVNIADMNEDGRNDIVTDVEVLLNLGPPPALWSQSTTRAAALRPGVWNSSVWPNPLVGPTQLRFNIAEASPVSVRLFDARGRLVRTLLDGRWTEAGPQELTIGQLGLRAGVYMYRIDAGGSHTGGRFVVLE